MELPGQPCFKSCPGNALLRAACTDPHWSAAPAPNLSRIHNAACPTHLDHAAGPRDVERNPPSARSPVRRWLFLHYYSLYPPMMPSEKLSPPFQLRSRRAPGSPRLCSRTGVGSDALPLTDVCQVAVFTTHPWYARPSLIESSRALTTALELFLSARADHPDPSCSYMFISSFMALTIHPDPSCTFHVHFYPSSVDDSSDIGNRDASCTVHVHFFPSGLALTTYRTLPSRTPVAWCACMS
jgi:hypothetical protein